MKEFSGRELVVSFTDVEFRSEGSEGSSQSRGAEESEGEDSELGCVLHDVLVNKSLDGFGGPANVVIILVLLNVRDWDDIPRVRFEKEVKK